jgi:cytoskeletal protein RodZ
MTQLRQKTPSNASRKFWVQLLVFAALALLFYLKPRIESWVQAQQRGPVPAESNAVDSTSDADESAEREASPADKAEEKSSVTESDAAAKSDSEASQKSSNPVVVASAVDEKPSAAESKPAAPKKKSGGSSPIKKMERTPEKKRPELSAPEKNNPPPADEEKEKSSDLGKLREIEDNVFESTAGLLYVPGGAEGHRLKHVMQHAKDNPSKPVHGVFDGDRDEILAVIDEAFMKAKKGGSDVRSEKQNGRRVYTVNLRRRIGQVGGSEGERQGHPDCRFVRIVLENENEVITAFPSKSF